MSETLLSPSNTQQLMTCNEAAQVLTVTHVTVRRMIHQGLLRGVRVSPRKMMVYRRSLEEWIAKNQMGQPVAS